VPRPAATVMLLRSGAEGLEVFMIVRHQALAFASGALVFPGGRVEAADHAIASQADLCPAVDGVDMAALAFRVAAIRETFEECGILLARPRGSSRLVSAAQLIRMEAAHQSAPSQDGSQFSAVLAAEALTLAPELLVPFAHWITPVTQPKRFDTLFLLAEAPSDQAGVHDGSESVDSLWIAPQQALAEAADGRYKLVFATQMNLKKLAQYGSVAEALDAARRSTVVTVTPDVLRTDSNGNRHIRIPPDAGYGGEFFTVDLPPAS
jgi:8-oxo-dGTP pyrophosphatase MutT (NUDIX family)